MSYKSNKRRAARFQVLKAAQAAQDDGGRLPTLSPALEAEWAQDDARREQETAYHYRHIHPQDAPTHWALIFAVQKHAAKEKGQ